MKSIKSVYKIGNGPSSSHTVGPYHAAQIFGERYPDADLYEVTLYGSLAFTGEGHGTGKAILEGLPGAKIIFDRETLDLPHPNTMRFTALKDGQVIASVRMFSIGGGSIRIENEASEEDKEVYPQSNFSEIVALCNQEKISIVQLIYILEGYQLRDYLKTVWTAMRSAVERGLKAKGILPGGLKLTRKAKYLYEKRCYNESADVAMNRVIAAYAYAVSEENAAENLVVTAPTCGACGVLPSILYYMQEDRGISGRGDPGRFGGGRPGRQCDTDKRKYFRRGVRLPGGDRKRMFHGGGSGRPALWAEHRPDRVRGGDRDGAQPRTYLRSC